MLQAASGVARFIQNCDGGLVGRLFHRARVAEDRALLQGRAACDHCTRSLAWTRRDCRAAASFAGGIEERFSWVLPLNLKFLRVF